MTKAAGAIVAFLVVFWTGSFAFITLGRGPSVERVVVSAPQVNAQRANAKSGDCPYSKPAAARRLHDA